MWQIDEHTAWSLGRFKPDLSSEDSVQRQLQAFLKDKLTISPPIHVRPPAHEWSTWMQAGLWGPKFPDGQYNWHRDTLTCPPDNTVIIDPNYILVWTNQFPTQYRSVFRRGVVYEARPYELTVLDNNWVEHRAPRLPMYKAEGRWFIRGQIRRWAGVKDVAGVHQLTL